MMLQVVVLVVTNSAATKPHILHILADDFGWASVHTPPLSLVV
jgi:hypothetical protein